MFRKHLVDLVLLSSVMGFPVVSAQDNHPIPPYKRVLSKEQAKRVAELEREIAQLSAATKFAEACKPAEKVLKIRTEAHSKDHWKAVNARIELETLSALSKQPAAEQKLFAGLGKLQKEAEVLVKRGLYSQAQPIEAQVLAIHRQLLGELHPDTARSYNNLGFNLMRQGKYAEARPLYEKALAIRRQLLGEQHPEMAESYGNLGMYLNAQAKYAEAQPLLDKALAIHRQVLGEQHPNTATSYDNVANNLDDQVRYAEAQPLHEKALAIYRPVLGEQHPHTAQAYNNLAINLNAQGKYAEALPLYEKYLAIRHQVLGEQHAGTAQAYNNLAINLNAQGRYVEAQLLYETWAPTPAARGCWALPRLCCRRARTVWC
jgi:tetratricopeptide (TPR) repeat protein